MNASRLPYLLLMLVTGWFGASAVQATDPASPIGFWKGQDGTFEMFESEGKLSARIVALNDPKTAEGKEKTNITIRIRRNAAIRLLGLSSYLALRRKVTLAGRTGRFTTRRAA